MIRKLVTLGVAAAVAVAVSAVSAQAAQAATVTGADAWLSPQATFYPLHQDNWRDSVTYDASVSTDPWYESVSGAVEVRTAGGQLVRSFPFADKDSYSTVHAKWGGRNSAGRLVRVGDYTISTVVDGVAYGSRVAHVRTRTFQVSHSVRRTGVQTVGRSKSGACYFDTYDAPHLILDSWGGSCSATWTLDVPRNARNVSGVISAVRAGSSIGSHYSTSKTRTSTGFRFTAKAWGWSAINVRYVQASWTTSVVR